MMVFKIMRLAPHHKKLRGFNESIHQSLFRAQRFLEVVCFTGANVTFSSQIVTTAT
jgi:hypothetical protein